MTDEAPGLPEASPVAPASGWRDGLRDMARGAEFGVWFSALFTMPVVCVMLGARLGLWGRAGFDMSAPLDLFLASGRWFAIAAALGAAVALHTGVIAWVYRGIAKRRGRPGPDRPTRRRRRRRRWAAVAGLGAAAMLGSTLAMDQWLRASTRELEEAAAETDALDPDWRLDDLMATRDEVPDEENSALVAAEVIDLLPDPWPPTPPRGADARETDAPDFATALRRAREVDPSRRLDEATAAAIRSELDGAADAVGVARSLADYDRGSHEIEIGPRVLDTLLPETQAARAVGRLLSADAVLLAHDGKPDEAIDSCRAVIATARSIGDEPFLISQLVRLAIDAELERLVPRVLASGEPSEESLAALQDAIDDERDQPRLWWGLRGERAMFVELIERLASGELSSEDIGGSGPAKGGGDGGAVVFGRHQIAVALRWFNELLEIPHLPEHQWESAYDAWESKLIVAKGSRFGMVTTALPILMMPASRPVIDSEKRIRAVFGSLVLLVAAERHRLATGRWPASVDEIDPDILPDPPLDPYTGEPYRMAYADGRLRIYTLGPNLKDEGGAYDIDKWGDRGRLGRDDVGVSGYDPELRGRPAVPIPAPGS